MQNTGKNNSFIRVWLPWVIPFTCIAFILLLRLFPAFIETRFSNGAYVAISTLQRAFTGLFAISLGDVLYIATALWLLFKLGRLLYKIFKKQLTRRQFAANAGKLTRQLLWVYIVFNLLWALNYNRLGIAYQLQLQPQPYTRQDLEKLICLLIDKTNHERRAIGNDSLPQPDVQQIFGQCRVAYDSIALRYPFLRYRQPSVKSSLFNKWGKYFGFTGYYNPFSGEAQVRTDIPRILLPYTTCHEMAHQLGYASESEANFAGYLACSSVQDHYFRYSVYMDLYKYAAYELLEMDPTARHGWELDSLVKEDLRQIRVFFMGQQNKVSPVMNSLYNQYLKANQQAAGINSYNEVIGWLIAYYKKYHTL
jgi:hypothetical protein